MIQFRKECQNIITEENAIGGKEIYMKKIIFSVALLALAVGAFACGHEWAKPPLKEINGYCIHGNIKGSDDYGLDDIRVYGSKTERLLSIYCDHYYEAGEKNVMQELVDKFTTFDKLLKELDKYDTEWFNGNCVTILTDGQFKPYKRGTKPVRQKEHFDWMD